MDAPRRAACGLHGLARGALMGLALVASGASAQSQSVCVNGDGAWVERLCYGFEPGGPFYGHTVLGETPEWSRLEVFYGPSGRDLADGQRGAVSWFPEGYPDGSLIFEDIAPRLFDVDGDGQPEAVVVESSARLGARLAVYELLPGPGFLAATPYIGRRNRWLAVAGIADFNGDGLIDIAYVDRPHLARVLRVWTFEDGRLREIAQAGGLTNHRIGEDFITGGVRDCGTGPEMVLADTGWDVVMIARVGQGQITASAGAPFSQAAIIDALACR